MVRLIPMLIVVASIVLPMYFSSRPRPRASLRTLYVIMVVLTFVWVLLCLRVYPAYVFPE